MKVVLFAISAVKLLSSIQPAVSNVYRGPLLFVAQDEADTVDIAAKAQELFSKIPAYATDATEREVLYENDPSGFMCSLAVVKGVSYPLLTLDVDQFVKVLEGGGYFNLGDGKSIATPVGSHVLIEAGQGRQFINTADTFTSMLSCVIPTKLVTQDLEDNNPGPETQEMDAVTFKTVDGDAVDILALDPPAEGESRINHMLMSTTAEKSFSVYATVLATEENYHVHEKSLIWTHVLKGNVVTSSASDPDKKIAIPEGSSMVLDKCEAHQLINLDGPDSPAILLGVFGPELQKGDSVAVADSVACFGPTADDTEKAVEDGGEEGGEESGEEEVTSGGAVEDGGVEVLDEGVTSGGAMHSMTLLLPFLVAGSFGMKL